MTVTPSMHKQCCWMATINLWESCGAATFPEPEFDWSPSDLFHREVEFQCALTQAMVANCNWQAPWFGSTEIASACASSPLTGLQTTRCLAWSLECVATCKCSRSSPVPTDDLTECRLTAPAGTHRVPPSYFRLENFGRSISQGGGRRDRGIVTLLFRQLLPLSEYVTQ